MAVVFTDHWDIYMPGDVATPSGPDAPSEEELVEELGVANYYTTEQETTTQTDTEAQSAPKSDGEVREELEADAKPPLSEQVADLTWGELQKLAGAVSDEVGEEPEEWKSKELQAFCLEHGDATRGALP